MSTLKKNLKNAKGLGDSVAAVTKATKLDKLAEQVAKLAGKEDCGCKKRQEKLNRLVSYNKNFKL
jgi:hypothetical protein